MTGPDNVNYLKQRVNLFCSTECIHYQFIFKGDFQIAKNIKFIIQKCPEIVGFLKILYLLCHFQIQHAETCPVSASAMQLGEKLNLVSLAVFRMY